MTEPAVEGSLNAGDEQAQVDAQEDTSASPAATSTSLAPVPSAASSPLSAASFLRVKPGNFSRLLYSNPVCLLTTSAPAAASGNAAAASQEAPVAATAAAMNSISADGSSAVLAESPSLPAVDSVAPAAAPPTAAPLPASAARPSPSPARNVMTISWLTPTSNHGEFVCSMHAGRYSARLLAASVAANETAPDAAAAVDASASPPPPPVGARFVLSVPVAGMESLVKSIGGCSGGDEDTSASSSSSAPVLSGGGGGDKFSRLGISPCRPGNKPLERGDAVASTGGSSKRPPPRMSAAQEEERAAGLEDESFDLLAIPGCAAHLVCQVQSTCLSNEQPTPRVQAHNVLFCRVTRAYVHRDYWVNGNNFVAAHPHVPPTLTFLGSGKFAHMVQPRGAFC